MTDQVTWKPFEDEILREGWLRGDPVPEIHKRLPGRTLWSVYARRPVIGLPPRRDKRADGSYNYRPMAKAR